MEMEMESTPTKVLIIDDHKETRELIAFVLNKHGYETLMAPGGSEGIQVARMKNPDIILLDMVMPHYSGIETCKAIKRLPAIKDIPVIFLTADKNKEDVIEAMKAGGNDYIVKPFNPDELLNRIQTALLKNKKDFDPKNVIKEDKLPDLDIGGK